MANKRRVDIYIDRIGMDSIYEKGKGIFTIKGLGSHPSIDHGRGHSDKTIIS